eukprot:1139125-Pelagomonas_calceolata.AAC.6
MTCLACVTACSQDMPSPGYGSAQPDAATFLAVGTSMALGEDYPCLVRRGGAGTKGMFACVHAPARVCLCVYVRACEGTRICGELQSLCTWHTAWAYAQILINSGS